MKYKWIIYSAILLIIISALVFFFLAQNTKNKAKDLLLNTPISEVLQNPKDYSAKTINISGVVTTSTNLGVKFYTINDGTAEIIVLTDKAVPRENTEVFIQGKARQYFKVFDKEMTVFIEEP